MTGIQRAHRMAFMAIVNGLRKGGDLSDASIQAIAAELRAATSASIEANHHDTTLHLTLLADAVEKGEDGARAE